jgi:ParB family chromosome partitioning protein
MADVGVGAGDAAPRSDRMVDTASLIPNPDQPRRDFDPEKLRELADSIVRRGVLQPIIVRPDRNTDGMFQIVAGERRWRAAQMARVHEVPVAIRDLSDSEVFEIAIIENIQRADLSPIEEARGFRQLMDRFGHTQEQIATLLGKSRSHVANLLRLLTLPEPVLAHLQAGRLSAGHARTLVGQPDAERIAERILAGGLNVRDAEALAKAKRTPKRNKEGTSEARDADTRALEGDLSSALGLSVRISHGAAGDGGRMTIAYRDLDQLDALCALLSHGLQRNQ